jgi:AP endonuclease 1
MHSIPIILETPAEKPEIWAEEIKLLYWMVGKEADDAELLERSKMLQDLGSEDREKQLQAAKRKEEKALKAGRRKRKRKEVENDTGSESDDSHR